MTARGFLKIHFVELNAKVNTLRGGGILREVRARRPDVLVIIGGPFVALHPEAVVGHCDYAVRCEGDEILPMLLSRISLGEDAHDVPGVSYLSNGKIVHIEAPVPPAIPATIPDLTIIDGFAERMSRPGARFDLVHTLQTSRGCRFNCRFCPTPGLFGGVYRNRDIDAAVAEDRRNRHNRSHQKLDRYGGLRKIRGFIFPISHAFGF